MSMMRAISLLGTGAEGFVQGQRDEQAAQRARNAEDFAQKQREFQLGEQQRTLQQRAELAAAAAPVQPVPDMAQTPDGPMQRQIKPETQDNIDVGQPGEQAPSLAVSVAGRGGLTAQQGAADAAAANDPEAVQARQMAVVQKYDPAAGMQMQAHATTLKAAKLEQANKTFDSQLNKAAAGGWESLTKFLGESGATPEKPRFVPAADGKTGEINFVQPDGSLKPTGMVYPNSQQGVLDAADYLSLSTPIASKVAHALTQQQLKRQEARDAALDEHNKRRDDLMDRYYQGLLDVKDDKNQIDADKAGRGTAGKMSPDDAAEYKSMADEAKELNSELVKGRMAAAQMNQPFDEKSPTLAPLFERQAILNRKMNKLLSSYRSGDAPGKPSGSGERITPEQQAANDSGRGAILAAELKNAKTEEDRAALRREISRLPAAERAKAEGLMAGGSAAPAVAPRPGPMAQAVAPAQAGPAAPAAIPDPPPQFRQVGIRQVQNPDYAAWVKAYGAEFERRRAAAAATDAAAASTARQTFNPYMQSRVQ